MTAENILALIDRHIAGAEKGKEQWRQWGTWYIALSNQIHILRDLKKEIASTMQKEAMGKHES